MFVWFPFSTLPTSPAFFASSIVEEGPLHFFDNSLLPGLRRWRPTSILVHNPYGVWTANSQDKDTLQVDSYNRLLNKSKEILGLTPLETASTFDQLFKQIAEWGKLYGYLGNPSCLAPNSARAQSLLRNSLITHLDSRVLGPLSIHASGFCFDAVCSDLPSSCSPGLLNHIRSLGLSTGIEHAPMIGTYWDKPGTHDFSMSYQSTLVDRIQQGKIRRPRDIASRTYILLTSLKEPLHPLLYGEPVTPIFPGWFDEADPDPSWSNTCNPDPKKETPTPMETMTEILTETPT